MTKTSLASELVGERPLPFEIALLIGDPFWQRVRRTSRLLEERGRRKGSVLTPAEVHKMNVIYEGALKTMASKAADDLIGEDKEEKKSKKKKE